MTTVVRFLRKNGFLKIESKKYANDKCTVTFEEDGYYAVANNKGDTRYSNDYNIYWLIGVLTYYGFIDKNYIK
jgi:hypothetical protein